MIYSFLLLQLLATIHRTQQNPDILQTKTTQITVPKGCCPGCGSKYQSDDEGSPGYLPTDKLEEVLAMENGVGAVSIYFNAHV